MSNLKCTCGVSLERAYMVTRRYECTDGVSVFGEGHYLSDGTFEPDHSITLPDGAQTYDGCDRCAVCGSVVG